MARIDVNTTLAGLANTVSDLIGVQLSETGEAPNNLPSVFVARDKNPKAAFPYAVVDKLNLTREGRDFMTSYRDPDTGYMVHLADYIVVAYVDIHGSKDDDTMGICQELSDRLSMHEGMQLIDDYTSFNVRDVSDISFSSNFMSTDYEEVSRIIVEIAARSELVDTTTGTITTINQQGEIYSVEIDSGTPLEADSSASSAP